MSELLDFYQQQAQAAILAQDLPWLNELKHKALVDLKQLGFPTRKNENWKYTLLDNFFNQPFTQNKSPNQKNAIVSGCPFEYTATLYNDTIEINDAFINKLPKGAIVQPLFNAFKDNAHLIKPSLGKFLHTEHGFHALNTAAMQTGLFIYLPAGGSIEEPIVINHWQDKENQALHIRHLIIAEKGSKACIIENYSGAEGCCYFTNVISEIGLAKDAQLVHYKIQQESKAAFHIGHVAVEQGTRSQCHSHSLSIGGKLVRSDFTFDLKEEHAQCLMNGIYLPAEKQHIDHHTTVNHLVPHCKSEQDYKGILMGQSRAVFNGRVVVAQHAQHTQAKQQNKNILLSTQAEINTKPQLEIFADDVVCSHGATVGQLDEDALFYLATRGISEQTAKRYLIQAFASDNLRALPHKHMANWMTNLINEQLG